MSRFKPYLVLPLILIPTGLASVSAMRSAEDIPAGTGYAALELCTRTLVSGEAFEHVRTRYVEPKVDPLPRIWHVEYTPHARVEIRSVLPLLGHPRGAVFRPGLGCTVVPPGTSEAAVRAQPFHRVQDPAPDARAWPLGEGAVESQLLTAAAGAVVEGHAQEIFRESSDDPKRGSNATALLVARDGHLVYERYGQGYAREQPQLGWSMTKTLTAMIAGLMQRDGKLALDAEVGLPQWKGSPKQAITWRQLLNMAPGLSWFEGYGGSSDATQMLFSQADQGAWVADRPLSSAPGTVFTYSTGFSNLAMLRMRQLLGGQPQALYDYYQSRLFAPLGVRGGAIEPDASGTPVGGARGVLRPVDWLRLGQLLGDGGSWNGQVILPPEHVAFMTAASPADPVYGGSLWRVASKAIPPALRARLPDDLVFFAGHMGQFVIVAPSRKLVVLRMGVTFGGSPEHDPALEQVMGLVADLLAAG